MTLDAGRKTIIKIVACVVVSVSFLAIAHEGHHKKFESPPPETQTILASINERYLSNVKPIFENKCFDCHGKQTRFPWYQQIPGVKQLIQSDMHEAKMHLDMESNFPFKSHATPIEDLAAIEKTITDNEMPPFRYRIMHSGSALTTEEKEKVHQWVQLGKEMLKEKTK